jgi:hypothetical protein
VFASGIVDFDFPVQFIPRVQTFAIFASPSPVTMHEPKIIELVQNGWFRDGLPSHRTRYSAASFSASAARFNSLAFASTSSTI